MTYEEWNLEYYRRFSLTDIESTMADARAAYVKRADNKLSSRDEWHTYVHLLHILRLFKRAAKEAENG